MKKSSFILALIFCFLFATPLCAGEIFTDVNSGDWFYEEVNEAYEHGLVAGTSQTTFSPNENMTRGQFVTILGRIEGIDTSDYMGFENSFTDLSFDYYIPYISWAYENGIVSGESETRFAPDKAITREQIAAILDRYISAMCYQLPDNPKATSFRDAAQVSSYAQNSMEAMRRYGIIAGDENGYCEPKKATPRCEGAAMLVRFYNLIIDATEKGNMGNGYCRLVCAATPSWMASYDNDTKEHHEALLNQMRPYFTPHINRGEELAAVVHTKLNGNFLYIGVTQKKVNSNQYKTANVIVLNNKMQYTGGTSSLLSPGSSTYGIISVKPYSTPEGIFLYIVHSHGSEVTTFDMILIGESNTDILSIYNTLAQIKKENGNIKIRLVQFVDYGLPLKTYAWETIDFTKFPHVLGF